jgi:hypothetical protein
MITFLEADGFSISRSTGACDPGRNLAQSMPGYFAFDIPPQNLLGSIRDLKEYVSCRCVAFSVGGCCGHLRLPDDSRAVVPQQFQRDARS